MQWERYQLYKEKDPNYCKKVYHRSIKNKVNYCLYKTIKVHIRFQSCGRRNPILAILPPNEVAVHVFLGNNPCSRLPLVAVKQRSFAKISCTKRDISKDWWMHRYWMKTFTVGDMDLIPVKHRVRLELSGLSHQMQLEAARAWLDWRECCKNRRQRKNLQCPFGDINKMANDIKFHEFIEEKMAQLPNSERAMWSTWTQDCSRKWQAYLTACVMILTPQSKDSMVKSIIKNLRTI